VTARGDIYVSERLAHGYAFHRPPVHPRVVELIARDLDVQTPRRRGLDVGCGAGLSTAALGRLVTDAVGLDPNGDMLVHRRQVAPAASFVVARAEAPPFAARSFDIVTAAGAVNYVDLAKFLPEAARLLVPGGFLVVYDFSSGRRIAGDPRLEAWFRRFEARWPFPEGYALEAGRLEAPESGLTIVRRREFETTLPLTASAYIDYVLTETNVEQAVQAGQPVEEIRNWCTERLAPIFDDGTRDVVFEGEIVYVRRKSGTADSSLTRHR
jgi:ubiquinone/menaquinone biosynthesis C-methylase UbiE